MYQLGRGYLYWSLLRCQLDNIHLLGNPLEPSDQRRHKVFQRGRKDKMTVLRLVGKIQAHIPLDPGLHAYSVIPLGIEHLLWLYSQALAERPLLRIGI
jgi:hypothetical protein